MVGQSSLRRSSRNWFKRNVFSFAIILISLATSTLRVEKPKSAALLAQNNSSKRIRLLGSYNDEVVCELCSKTTYGYNKLELNEKIMVVCEKDQEPIM